MELELEKSFGVVGGAVRTEFPRPAVCARFLIVAAIALSIVPVTRLGERSTAHTSTRAHGAWKDDQVIF